MRRFALRPLLLTAAVVVIFGAAAAILFGTLRPTFSEVAEAEASPTVSVVGVASTPEAPTPTETSTPVNTPTPAEIASLEGLVAQSTPSLEATATSMPGQEGTIVTLEPDGAIWWRSDDRRPNYRNDSFLYAGLQDGQTYLSATYFDLEDVPRGAPLYEAALELTGLRTDNFAPAVDGTWGVQMIAEAPSDGGALPPSTVALLQSNFAQASAASASPPLGPNLSAADLEAGAVNRWQFTDAALSWLEQQLVDEKSRIYIRIIAEIQGDEESLFAWDSGIDSESSGAAPQLTLDVGPAPTAEPPTPTPVFAVATLTPTPRSPSENATRIARAAQTAEAAGPDATPTPFTQVFTPTPVHQSVETAQVAALSLGQAPVIVDTPTPRSDFEATEQAEYATAIAITQGTGTPFPEVYVTPLWVEPTTTPANPATAIAREQNPEAPADLPYNAIVIEYVLATPTPENAATAQARQAVDAAQRTQFGAPTPLPAHVRIFTQTPTPLPTWTPTQTPIPLILDEAVFTPTPTSLVPTQIPDVVPGDFRGRILFLSDRTGEEKLFAIEPATGALSEITQRWVYDLAREQYLPFSPTGDRKAIVERDENFNQIQQIKVLSFEYDTKRSITGTSVPSYDPAWSPVSDRIAYVNASSGSDEIYTVDAEGNNQQQLTDTKGVWEKHPTWSPDGSQIAFVSNRTGKNQIWIMNADGSGAYNLSNNAFEDRNPIWVR